MENKKVLSTYCLYDKETSVYDCFAVGYDASDTIKYYMGMFRDIIFQFSKDDDNLSRFEEKLKNTCIMKLADFDSLKGEFINNKNYLVDYLDINVVRNYFDLTKIKEKENNNNES